MLAATFLGGAKSRLLPASVPFRFFAAAAVFHVLMWLVLTIGGDGMTRYAGGVTRTLAAVHLLTLGVFVTTAIGAAVQLLPVATRRALVAVWPIKLVFWLVVPGLAVLVVGMCEAELTLLAIGAVAVTLGLLLFAALLADNLRRAGILPVVSAYGWTALASLVALVALGLALSLNYTSGFLPNHSHAALAHMILGGFGFMGLLALGFSHVLVPMFALASAPAKMPSFLSFAAAAAAVALGAAGALAGSRELLTIAALLGLAAAGLHIALMRRVLATGMRKRLGLSFVLVRAAWAMLVATLLVGLASLYGLVPNGATLFGLLLLGGWLLTFLIAILQRIVPFLASMFVTSPARGGPPLLSEIASDIPLTVHAICHGVAMVGLAVAIVFDLEILARAASAVGLLGALAFAWFTAAVLRRLIVDRIRPAAPAAAARRA
jgi:hypothetical protein